jgi:hypothetical protein
MLCFSIGKDIELKIFVRILVQANTFSGAVGDNSGMRNPVFSQTFTNFAL